MIGWNFLKECHNRLVQKIAAYLGYPESAFKRSVFETICCSLLTWGLFALGAKFWPAENIIVCWLFSITIWAFLHVRKSSTTWSRFDEIDERDLDFHNSIDQQLESIQSRISKLEASTLLQGDRQAGDDVPNT